MSSTQRAEGSVLVPAILMIVISLVLFWLPFLGPVIAGVIGGRRAGSAGRALTAALLPSLFFAALLTVALTVFGLPFMGVAAGLGFTTFAIFNSGALLLGALIGGLL